MFSTPSAAKREENMSVDLFPWTLFYRAALPWEVVDELACREIWQDIQAIIEAEDGCSALREDVAQRLFDCVAALPRDAVEQRTPLIQLKRNLYNLRPNVNQQALMNAYILLPEDGKTLLSTYIQLLQNRNLLAGVLPAKMEQLFSQGRNRLREHIQHTPALLNGIVLASPDLYEQVWRYAQTPLAAASKLGIRLSKEEASFLLYLIRTATKTSAFSTFTSVGLAHCKTGADQHCHLEVPAATLASSVQLNHLPLVLLTHALARHPEVYRHLPLHINPYCRERDGRLSVVRLSSEGIDHRRFAYEQAELFSIALTPSLSSILAHVAVTTPCTPASLIAWVQNHMPMTTQAQQKPDQLVQRLLQLQVLVFDIVGMQTEHPLRDLIVQLEQLPPAAPSPLPTILQQLHTVEADINEYAQESAPQRAVKLRSIVTALKKSFQATGDPVADEVLQLPLYENNLLVSPDATISLPEDSELLQDLHLFTRSLPLFSNLALIQKIQAAFFVQTYGRGGRCENAQRFLLEARRALADEFASLASSFNEQGSLLGFPASLSKHSEEVQYILQLRTNFLSSLGDLVNTAEPEIELKRDWLREYVAALPDAGAAFWQQYACLCQSVPQLDRDWLVLNIVTDGWGKQIGSYSIALKDILEQRQQTGKAQAAEETLLRPLERKMVAPAGHEFVEVAGRSGFNANVHLPMTRRVLVLPGEWSDRPLQEQLLLTDITIVHDEEQNRLRLLDSREGTEIHLLYLGLLAPVLLGPFHRMLLPFMQAQPLWSDASLIEALVKTHTPLGTEPLVYPRIRLGQLVLSRRKWLIPTQLWPQWESRQLPDVAHLLHMERWRRSLGIPPQVFVRPTLSTVTRAKPQFVDFHNALLLAALPKRLHSEDGWLKVEEALPMPQSLHPARDGGRFASAFWLEFQ